MYKFKLCLIDPNRDRIQIRIETVIVVDNYEKFSVVGGPLVKGLTQVAKRRPTNPIGYLADFLYEFLNLTEGSSSPIKEPTLEPEVKFLEEKSLVEVEDQKPMENANESDEAYWSSPQTNFLVADRVNRSIIDGLSS